MRPDLFLPDKLFFCLEEKVGLAAIAEYDNQKGGHNLRRGRVPAERSNKQFQQQVIKYQREKDHCEIAYKLSASF
jgi:hypothetical protein